MHGLDKCIASMGMTRSSCRPRQFLSRSHREVHGEMTLFCTTRKILTPKDSGYRV